MADHGVVYNTTPWADLVHFSSAKYFSRIKIEIVNVLYEETCLLSAKWYISIVFLHMLYVYIIGIGCWFKWKPCFICPWPYENNTRWMLAECSLGHTLGYYPLDQNCVDVTRFLLMTGTERWKAEIEWGNSYRWSSHSCVTEIPQTSWGRGCLWTQVWGVFYYLHLCTSQSIVNDDTASRPDTPLLSIPSHRTWCYDFVLFILLDS